MQFESFHWLSHHGLGAIIKLYHPLHVQIWLSVRVISWGICIFNLV